MGGYEFPLVEDEMTTPAGFPGAWLWSSGPLALGSYGRVWGGVGGGSDDGFDSISGNLEGIGVRGFIQPLILKTECTSGSCAWRSPRALSGFFASTPQSSQGECALRSRLRTKTSAHRTSVSCQNLDSTLS